MKTQVVKFMYGILNKELRHLVYDAMLLQLAQPTLASVFQLLKCIDLNMVEEHVVTINFNKDNLKNILTPLIQQ
jgi:hypothetical protein